MGGGKMLAGAGKRAARGIRRQDMGGDPIGRMQTLSSMANSADTGAKIAGLSGNSNHRKLTKKRKGFFVPFHFHSEPETLLLLEVNSWMNSMYIFGQKVSLPKQKSVICFHPK